MKSGSTSRYLISDFLKQHYDAQSADDRDAMKALTDSFFTKHGLADKLRGEYDKAIKNLSLPKFVQEHYEKVESSRDASEIREDEVLSTLKDNFAENRLHIFPSFYKFLIYLRKQKAEFGLIARTFDSDLAMVVNELG